jgi:hypothetical protein
LDVDKKELGRERREAKMFNLLLSKGVWTNTSFVRGWLGPAL